MQQHNPRLRRDLELIEPAADADSGPAVMPGDAPAAAGAREAALPEGHGVRELRRLIEERLFQPASPEPDPVGSPGVDGAASQRVPELSPATSKLPIRLVKLGLGLAIVALFGWVPIRTLMQSSSVEAIVNARVVSVRAPIEGEVVATPTDLSGAGVIAGNEPLLRIRNMRADRARLDSLQDQLAELQIQQPALDAKIAAMQRAYDALAAAVSAFTAGRIRQLEARTAALSAAISAAAAQRALAQSDAKRAIALGRSDTMSAAAVERLMQAEAVAEQNEIVAERELDAAVVELDAARAGSFIGDSYNDMPSSAQRRDDLRQRIDDATADRDAGIARIARLKDAAAAEEALYQAHGDVVVSLPVSGRIWEVMTAPGEYVEAGQELLKLLDCSGAVVTANVTEAVYNGLSVGSPARFRPTDGGGDLAGVVTNLTGLADAPANLAIVPSALAREAYRVTVRVPELASGESCAVGRTGRVIFDKAPPG